MPHLAICRNKKSNLPTCFFCRRVMDGTSCIASSVTCQLATHLCALVLRVCSACQFADVDGGGQLGDAPRLNK